MRSNPRVRRIGESVHDYESANSFLGNKQERKLANNTLIVRGAEDSIGVVLHRTTIVRYYPDGRIQLDSGGWRTVTTKQRINQLLPYPWRLDQTKYEWHVRDIRSQESFEFEDGMMLGGEATEHLVNPPGKFDSAVEEVLYEFAGDSSDHLSIEDGGGWWGLVLDATKEEVMDFAHHTDISIPAEELREWEFPIHAIVHERSDGIVETETFDSAKEAEEAWEELSLQVEGEED